MNKSTRTITEAEYKELITTIRTGIPGIIRPNNRVAMALVLEASLGLRIGDVLDLRLCDIIKDGDRMRLDIIEDKTGKKRTFTVPDSVYQYIMLYCIDNEICKDEKIIPIKVREVQRVLATAAESLGYERIGTHSFRKYFATDIYINNNYNIVLVQQLLQHSSAAITQRYIGISTQEIEAALLKHNSLL